MPRLKRRLSEDIKGAVDTASTSTAAPLTRASSGYCDSSCCLLCQGPESLPESQPASLQRARNSSSTSVQLHQQLALTLEGGGTPKAAAACSAASAQAGGSQASSQTAQGGMVFAGERSPEQEAEVVLENGRGHAAASREGSTTPCLDSEDDFVTVERADLRHGYASSTNLLQQVALAGQQLAALPHKRQRVGNAAALDDAAGFSGRPEELASVSGRSTASWQWRPEYDEQEDPCPAQFLEIAAFERPMHSQHKRQHADIVCGVEFSPDGNLLACAGVAKQIRVYPLHGVRGGEDDAAGIVSAAFIHRLPSKMSSIAWCPFDEGVVTVGDYDGVVAQVHIASGHLVADVDEHAGRRVWSVAHSQLRPHLCASTSDDGTARLLAGRGLAQPAGLLRLPAGGPICSAAFCPEDEHALALAGADACAYLFDLRKPSAPLQVVRGHTRAVSYVRFMGGRRLVTASVDSSLALWDLHTTAAPPSLFRRYTGHANVKNFVGLSVREDDELMATGSESGQAYTYHRAWSAPVAAHGFDGGSSQQSQQVAEPSQAGVSEFASAVCWWPGELGGFGAGCRGPVLAAGRSDGDLRLLTLVNAF